jgi:hypothetical protein
MKFSFALFISLCFFIGGCGDNKNNTEGKALSAQDSIKLQNKVYAQGLVSLANEKSIQSLLCQGWIMDDDLEVLKNNGEAEGNYPVRCFYLFDDFTYTRNMRNGMEYGKWSYDDRSKLFTLKNADQTQDEYKVAAIGPDDMIVINSEINSVTKLRFIGSGKKYANKNDDPFYIENNRWRIRPSGSESDEQVRKRLKECLHFYMLFYRDNLARQEAMISFYGLPTCLRWYRGGIHMVKKADLAGNWFQCFYNKEQAMKAYKMVEDVIMKKYNWPKEKMSWVKMNLLVLEQIYANI